MFDLDYLELNPLITWIVSKFTEERSFMFKGQEVTIVHIVEDMSPVSGGVATVVRMLSNVLSSEKIKHVVVCNKADKTVVGQSVTLKIFKPGKYDLGWGYSRQACDYLVDISSSRNVVFHIHGIWKSLHFFAAKISRERDVPCVLTAHAMLDNWFWYGQGWLKRLKKNLYWTFLSYNFKKLHCLHAITPSETLNLKTLLPNAEVVTIPNTMYVPTINRFKQYSGDQGKYFLFIGRIDAQKGLAMFEKVNIPILGIVENMSIHICSNCNHAEEIFGNGGGERMAASSKTKFLGALPLKLEIRTDVDEGNPSVAKDPESKVSMMYQQIARNVAATLSLQSESIGAFPKITIE